MSRTLTVNTPFHLHALVMVNKELIDIAYKARYELRGMCDTRIGKVKLLHDTRDVFEIANHSMLTKAMEAGLMRRTEQTTPSNPNLAVFANPELFPHVGDMVVFICDRDGDILDVRLYERGALDNQEWVKVPKQAA